MTRTRPPVVLVFAVLNIVFGSLGLLVALCSGVFQLILDRLSVSGAARAGFLKDMLEIQEQMQREVPAYTAVTTGGVVVLLVLTSLMIVAGIGLLKMKPWARPATMVWSVVLILYQIAYTIYQIVLVNPVQIRLQQEMIARQPRGTPNFTMGPTATAILQGAGGLVVVAYAGAFLAVMLLPAVSAAFAGRPLPSSNEPKEYYDDRSSK